MTSRLNLNQCLKGILFGLLFAATSVLNAQEFDLDKFFKEELKDMSETDRFDQILVQANENYDIDMNASLVLIDSLKQQAQRINLTDERQLNYDMVLADVYMAAGQLNLAKKHVSKLFKRLNSFNTEVPEVRISMGIYESLASYALLEFQLDSALYYYGKELDLALSLGDTLTVLSTYNSKGIVYEMLGIYDLAIENLFEALQIAEQLGDKKSIVTNYNNLGIIHQENGNYETGREYLLKGISLIEEIGWESENGYAHGNLGYNYFYVGDYDQALDHALKSQTAFEKFGFEAELTLVNSLLGRIYVKLNKVSLGDKHLDMALNMATPEEFTEAYIEVLFGKSEVARERGNYRVVETKLVEAVRISETQNLNKLRLTAMEFLVDHYEERNSYVKAFKLQQRLANLKDSILNERKNFQISDLQTRYETAKKEEAIIQGNLDLEKQKSRTNTIILGLILVLILTGVMIYFYLRIKKTRNQLKRQNEVISDQNKELDALNSTKDKFFSIIAHDLRSPMIGLQGVGQKLEYFIRKNKQEKLLEMGNQIDQSIDQLNHLLNNLLNWAVSQTGGIPNNPENIDLNKLTAENINLYQSQAQTKEIQITNNLNNLAAYADLNTMATVIRNLLSNAIKFTRVGGEIIITGEEASEYVIIRIKDEGPGMEANQLESLFSNDLRSSVGTGGEKGFGLGLKLCKEFMEMNNGKIAAVSEQGYGTTFKISLPDKTKDIN